jgi:uncharacterized glyoxalase superfamily protein PhnB
MPCSAVPMFHVPDVAATANWYASIGFTVRDRASDGDEVVWASLNFGDSEVMLSAGGKASDAPRREVDLYVRVDDVGATFARLKDKAEIVEGLHDTFYGMREFIIRDCNRFWITFGQPATVR